MLLTFFEQFRCSVKQCCITHSLSMRDWIEKSAYKDRLTHFLLVIWSTTGSFPKHQNSAMSLTSCRLLDKTADHKEKHYSQTVVMRQCIIYASAMSPTHWYWYYHILLTRIWRQLTSASLSCLLAIWSVDNLVFMKAFKHYLPSDELCM